VIVVFVFPERFFFKHQKALTELFVSVEDSVFFRIVEDDGLDEAGTDAVDEVVDLLIVGVKAVGQALDKRMLT
jgi:hypothetical protein